MTASIDAWRGIRFATLAHPFARPERTAPVAPRPAPGGEFGPAPFQPPVAGLELAAGRSSTECLTLNVWAPSGAAGLPVAVWVFGGGFEVGAASTPLFDGSALAAAARCVVVTVNYRVGAFGFGHLARHGGLLAHAHNLGLQDLGAALRWIDDGIAEFGGDPSRVTVIGQSAGAFLAAAAVAAPGVPRPRAVACFSGGASRVVSEEDAVLFADAILEEIGLSDEPELLVHTDPSLILDAQVAVAPRDLSVRNGARPAGFGVVLDAACPDPIVPRHPLEAVASGDLRDVFVLAAAGVDEMAGFDPDVVPSPAGSLADAVAGLAGEEGRRAAPSYRRGEREREWRRVLGDYIYRLPAARLVDAQRKAGGGAAYLEIGRERDAPGAHGAELPGIFARGDDERGRAVQRILVELIGAGRVSGGALTAPLVAGRRPDDSLLPAELLATWQGVPRP